jgi:LysM repeat protein
VAIVLAFAAVVLVVTNTTSNGDEGGGSDNATRTTEDRPRQQGNQQQQRRPQRAFYRVRLNDTLGLIAEQTGVPVEQLEALNPELDPQNLIVGQRIRLRE